MFGVARMLMYTYADHGTGKGIFTEPAVSVWTICDTKFMHESSSTSMFCKLLAQHSSELSLHSARLISPAYAIHNCEVGPVYALGQQ